MRILPTDALLVIDLQNDFCPGGALAVDRGDEIVPVINSLAQKFAHVVMTQDWHPAGHISFASAHPGGKPFEIIDAPYGPQALWPDHCVQNTAGAAFHPALDVPHAEMILRKGFRKDIDSYSAFTENDHVTPTGLAGYLHERGINPPLSLRAGLRFLRQILGDRWNRAGLRVPGHRRRHAGRQFTGQRKDH